MKSLDNMKGLNIEKIVKAIEVDAGEVLPDLRTALAEVKTGNFASVHTPGQPQSNRHLLRADIQSGRLSRMA